jgi:hypothetical protein
MNMQIYRSIKTKNDLKADKKVKQKFKIVVTETGAISRTVV